MESMIMSKKKIKCPTATSASTKHQLIMTMTNVNNELATIPYYSFRLCSTSREKYITSLFLSFTFFQFVSRTCCVRYSTRESIKSQYNSCKIVLIGIESLLTLGSGSKLIRIFLVAFYRSILSELHFGSHSFTSCCNQCFIF